MIKTTPIVLNYVRATFANGNPANKIFSTINADNSISTYIADVERASVFNKDEQYNKNCFLSVSESTNDSQLLHLIYPVEQCFFKSAIYSKGKTARADNTYDFLNITNHCISANNRLSTFIQVDNNIYGLEQASKYGRFDITCDIFSYISANNGLLSPVPPLISTAIYNKEAIVKAIKDDNISALQANAVRENLSSVEYNMLYEMPGNVYNDFESGNIAANTFKCKNSFNATYDMVHDNDNILKHARTYRRLEHCNSLIYATYNDNVNYNSQCIKTTNDDNCLFGYKCDKVEVISKANRYSNVNGHKTNAYSVIVHSNLFSKFDKTDDILQLISNNMKQEIKNAVSDIVKKLAPISTQLVNVDIIDIVD